MNTPIDDTRCPLCHQSNRCMANQDKPCWCARTAIPEALIEQVSKELKNRACICSKCVEAFKAKSVHFVSPKQ